MDKRLLIGIVAVVVIVLAIVVFGAGGKKAAPPASSTVGTQPAEDVDISPEDQALIDADEAARLKAIRDGGGSVD